MNPKVLIEKVGLKSGKKLSKFEALTIILCDNFDQFKWYNGEVVPRTNKIKAEYNKLSTKNKLRSLICKNKELTDSVREKIIQVLNEKIVNMDATMGCDDFEIPTISSFCLLNSIPKNITPEWEYFVLEYFSVLKNKYYELYSQYDRKMKYINYNRETIESKKGAVKNEDHSNISIDTTINSKKPQPIEVIVHKKKYSNEFEVDENFDWRSGMVHGRFRPYVHIKTPKGFVTKRYQNRVQLIKNIDDLLIENGGSVSVFVNKLSDGHGYRKGIEYWVKGEYGTPTIKSEMPYNK